MGYNPSSVPVGFQVKKYGMSLVLENYETDKHGVEKARCNCSGCGTVIPALSIYTAQNLENWFVAHVRLFQKNHGVNMDNSFFP